MTDRNSIPEHSPGYRGSFSSTFPRCVDKDEVLALELDRERRLLCTKGLMWVTVEDDRNDYLLGGGRDMALPAGRKLVMEAEETSCFKID